MKFDKIAEVRIKQAERSGKLRGLEGEGKPLKASGSDGSVEAFGYGAMASEGVIPEEIELKKAIEHQKKLMQTVTEPALKKREMQKLADLQMRLSMQEEARRKYFG